MMNAVFPIYLFLFVIDWNSIQGKFLYSLVVRLLYFESKFTISMVQ